MSVTKYVNYCGLSVIGCCFRSRRGFIPGNINDVGEQKQQQEENLVILDTSKMGQYQASYICLPVYVIFYLIHILHQHIIA